MRLALACVGFTSITAQILLMREMVATFYGNELLFGLILTAWLGWVALGSWTLPRLPVSGRGSGTVVLALGLALAGGLLPAEIGLVRGARTLLGVTPGAFIEFGSLLAAIVLILAPLCLLTGFLFALAARLMAETGGTGGQAYAWESIGAVAGGMLFSFVLIHWLNPFQIALLMLAANLSLAVYLVRASPPELAAVVKFALVFVVLATAALPLGRFLHAATLGWQWSDLLFAADSPYGRLTIQARDGQRAFFENGLLAFETQGTFAEEVAHFPLLAHPQPRSVLLIGGGVAGDVREILKHPVTRLTYVELDPLLIQAARTYLPPPDAAVLDDARLDLILTDGRLYVRQLSRLAAYAGSDDPAGAFDVVILDLPEPATGALNRFYTREFFAEVRRVLSPGGVFAFGLPSAENYWNPELARRNASLYHTLQAVFPHVLVLPGEHNFFLASELPLQVDPNLLAGRLKERGLETRWVTPEYIEYVLGGDRFAEVQRQLGATGGVQINTDLTPICYYYDLAVWLSRFYPGLTRSFQPGEVGRPGSRLPNLAWLALPMALGVLLVRWRRRWAAPAIAAVIGLAGMTIQMVLLFAFQVLYGSIYAQVSLIVTTFMAGLALGAAGIGWLLPRRSIASAGPARWALIGLQLAIAAYTGLFVLVLHLSIPAPAPVFPVLALVAGLLGGAAFPLVLGLMPGGQTAGRAVGLLYGADLLGGCLGALLGGIIFIPLLGIPQTCALVALVALAGVLMTLLDTC
jgi:spermidine synthase